MNIFLSTSLPHSVVLVLFCAGVAVNAGPPSVPYHIRTTKQGSGKVEASSPQEIVLPQANINALNKQLESAFRQLDTIEKSVEEWGHAGISSLILLPDSRGRASGQQRLFDIGEGTSYSDIVKELDTKVQGGVAISDERSLGISGKGRFGQDDLLKSEQDLAQRQDEIAGERLESANSIEQINQELKLLEAQAKAEDYRQKVENRNSEPLPLPENSAPASADLLAAPAITPGVTLPTPDDATGRKDADPATRAKPKTEPDSPAQATNDPFKDTKFADFQGLLNKAKESAFRSDLALPPAQKFRIAGGAKVTESLMRFLADPSGSGLIAENRVLFLGVGTVSVSPGWRTRQDYVCEVQVQPNYIDQDGKRIETEAPGVVSAFPFVESQVLDLQFSQRRQFQLLLDLAGAYAASGQTASAQLLLNYMRRYQRDVATRSALPVVVPSSDGTQLTYRFDPALQAVDDPGAKRGAPASLLQPNNIPVLVLLSCTKEEVIKYPQVGFRTSVRWLRATKRHWANQVAVDWWKKGYIRGTRYTSDEHYQNALVFDRVFTLARWFKSNFASPDIAADAEAGALVFSQETNQMHSFTRLQEFRNRFRTLETLARGVNLSDELPLPLPFIEKASLHSGEGGKGSLAIQGDGFALGSCRPLVEAVYVHGKKVGGMAACGTKADDNTTVSENGVEVCIDGALLEALGEGGSKAEITVVTKGGRVNYASLDGRFLPDAPGAAVVNRVSPAQTAPLTDKELVLLIDVANFGSCPEFEASIGGRTTTQIVTYAKSRRLKATFDLAGLPVGKYDVDVWNTEAAAVLRAGFVVGKPPSQEPSVAIKKVSPTRGYIRASTWMLVEGKGFLAASGQPTVQEVLVGGRHCRYQALSDALLLVVVPPWATGTELPTIPGQELTVVTSDEAATFPPAGNEREKSLLLFNIPEPAKELFPVEGLDTESRILIEALQSRAARNQLNLSIGK
jgi:hypothetical protein